MASRQSKIGSAYNRPISGTDWDYLTTQRQQFFESTEGGISFSRLWATGTSRECIRWPLFSIHGAEQNDFLAADAACGLSALPDRALQYFLRYGQAEILKELPAERVKLEFNLRGLSLGENRRPFVLQSSREKQIAFRPTRTRSGVPWQETPQYLPSHRDDRSNSNARRPPPPLRSDLVSVGTGVRARPLGRIWLQQRSAGEDGRRQGEFLERNRRTL